MPLPENLETPPIWDGMVIFVGLQYAIVYKVKLFS